MTDREFFSHEMGEVKVKLDTIHKKLFGNGSPEGSLAWKIEQAEQFRKTVKRGFWAMATGLFGAIGAWVWTVFKH